MKICNCFIKWNSCTRDSIEKFKFKKGDEVIVPSLTIISCLSAIVRSEAKPVFYDVDPLTWNMNLDEVKEVTTKNTKAVLLVHTYGLPFSSNSY